MSYFSMKQLLIYYYGGRYIPCEQNVQIEHIPKQNFECSRLDQQKQDA